MADKVPTQVFSDPLLRIMSEPNMDECLTRHPSTLSDEELNAVVDRWREERASWTKKQDAKGKEE